nr:hypothetical protein [Pseudonocardia humida]
MGAAAVWGGDGPADRVGDAAAGPADVQGRAGAVEDDGDDSRVAAQPPRGGGGQGVAEVEVRRPEPVLQIRELHVHGEPGDPGGGQVGVVAVGEHERAPFEQGIGLALLKTALVGGVARRAPAVDQRQQRGRVDRVLDPGHQLHPASGESGQVRLVMP